MIELELIINSFQERHQNSGVLSLMEKKPIVLVCRQIVKNNFFSSVACPVCVPIINKCASFGVPAVQAVHLKCPSSYKE